MIRKQDILDRATEWGLRPDVVEKDYVLGWLLAALALHDEARSTWIFKGGTCIKKCYFETYRFSEDLDFSLKPGTPYSESALRAILVALTRIAGDLSGIRFPEDLVTIRQRRNQQNQPTFQGRVAYSGPLAFPGMPRVLFDITQHEPVLEAPSQRSVFHPYPDNLPDGVQVHACSLNELIAEKTRALYERTRPRDLYDVVYLLENQPHAFGFSQAHEVLRKKCAVKNLQAASSAELLRIVQTNEELRSEWSNMLAHQLPALPDLDSILLRLPPLIQWVDEALAVIPETRLTPVAMGTGKVPVAPAGIRYWGGGSPLEAIRFAGSSRLLIEFDYHGKHLVTEPYSLRRASTGNLLFYGWEAGSDHIKALNVSEMLNAGATNRSFRPRDTGWNSPRSCSSWEAHTRQTAENLRAKPEWALEDFANVIRSYLSIVYDGHTVLRCQRRDKDGLRDQRFMPPTEFLGPFFADVRVRKSGDSLVVIETLPGLSITVGAEITGVPVIGRPASVEAGRPYLLPTLPRAAGGAPEYLLGLLANVLAKPPESVRVGIRAGSQAQQVNLPVHRGRCAIMPGKGQPAWKLEREPLPVLAVRSMIPSDLDGMVATADTLRVAPAVVLDVRANGGGSDTPGMEWSARLSGRLIRCFRGFGYFRAGETDAARRWNTFFGDNWMARTGEAPAVSGIPFTGRLFVPDG